MSVNNTLENLVNRIERLEEEKAAIAEVVASGRFTMGPKVAEFERVFAKSIGRKYAVMVNSGSSANLVGVASLFFRPKG
jgi:CDP-6-deoxy-D-xylo-4-hexulose-3-dehydrase